MSSVTISLITVTFNTADTIERCIASVIAQAYPNLQYIIIDGRSTDGTMAIINKYQKHITHIVSEPDKGIYDAMNKGIALATADVVGILNADDYFADNSVLKAVAMAFGSSKADIVYGDIDYVNKQDKVIRKWRSGDYKPGCFNKGWMPPHPSFYVKRRLFAAMGTYNLQYGSAADYELMLRFIHPDKHRLHYNNKVMVKMLIGGAGNKNLSRRISAWRNDFKAMRDNGLAWPYITVVLKPLRKIIQYVR